MCIRDRGKAVGTPVGWDVGLGLVQLHVCTSGSVNSALAEGQLKPSHVTPGSFSHLNLLSARLEMKHVCRCGQLCVAGDEQWWFVGAEVGLLLGLAEGVTVGAAEGVAVGATVGELLGASEGVAEGEFVG